MVENNCSKMKYPSVNFRPKASDKTHLPSNINNRKLLLSSTCGCQSQVFEIGDHNLHQQELNSESLSKNLSKNIKSDKITNRKFEMRTVKSRKNVFVIVSVLLLLHVCCVDSQGFDADTGIDIDDNFDDDKSTTTSRENGGGHSFSSSPYPHQVLFKH